MVSVLLDNEESILDFIDITVNPVSSHSLRVRMRECAFVVFRL